MVHIQGNNRYQIRMLSLVQMVEPESLVRIIDTFVDMLDLEKFDFNYFKLNINRTQAISGVNTQTPLSLN